MTGPGGKSGCSLMNCLKPAVSEYIYCIDRIGQEGYDVTYRWCKAHDRLLTSEDYPYFILKEHKTL